MDGARLAPEQDPGALTRQQAAFVWDLRGYWGQGTVVTATLDNRCLLPNVVGRVTRVSVTGAFAVIDGWHLPMDHVLRVERATVEQKDQYDALAPARQELLANLQW